MIVHRSSPIFQVSSAAYGFRQQRAKHHDNAYVREDSRVFVAYADNEDCCQQHQYHGEYHHLQHQKRGKRTLRFVNLESVFRIRTHGFPSLSGGDVPRKAEVPKTNANASPSPVTSIGGMSRLNATKTTVPMHNTNAMMSEKSGT
jgi:hypothetical protein